MDGPTELRHFANLVNTHGHTETGEFVFGLGVMARFEELIALNRKQVEQSRWGTPAIIGSAGWLNRQTLPGALKGYAGCLIVDKPRRPDTMKIAQKLEKTVHPLPGHALFDAADVAMEDTALGPYSPPLPSFDLGPLRVAGNQTKKSGMLHAKLALLGAIDYIDRYDPPEIEPGWFFRWSSAWLSSANFTYGADSNIEFGLQSTDPALIDQVLTSLKGAIRISEQWDSDSPDADPQLKEVKFDDQAFVDYFTQQAIDLERGK